MTYWLRRQRLVVFLLLSLLCATPQLVIGRDWKPSPQKVARNYLQITHEKSPLEIVIVNWSVPEGLSSPSPELRSVLREHLVISITHVTATARGEMTPRPRGRVVIKDTTGATREPLAVEALGYNVTFALNLLRQIFSQTGVIGKAMHFYVFEPKGIESCKEGQFWVVYEGEEYDYKTPIPGCR